MMTDEDAAYYAETMTDLQREVIMLCSPKKSWGYSRLAEKTGSNHADVSAVGNFLQAANLARISHIRHGQEFAGSAIFLNERGERVRIAVERLTKNN